MKCKYCGEEASFMVGKFKKIPCCRDSWTKCPAIKRKNSEKQKELYSIVPHISEDRKRQISQANLQRSSEWHRLNGEKISAAIQKKVEAGEWHTSLARKMHIEYNGIDLHGKWELEYARYLDDNQIEWKRPKDRFAYEFKGKTRWYTPDFYLVSSKEFVEIKGYETEKDRAKWAQFPATLIVLHGEDLLKMGLDIIV
jgi:hypothetical protein